MKAIVYDKYGAPEGLHIKDVEKPTPKENEVLVKVYAASINSLDWRFLRASPFLIRFMAGLFKPKNKILGADIAGEIEAVGAEVSAYKPGDKVFGDFFRGGYAEYVCGPVSKITPMPQNVTFEAAAALPVASLTAIQGLRDRAQLSAGQKVLVTGASGGVGSFAVQIAKSYGGEVTGVCSAGKVDFVRSLGADHVIDYSAEDFTQSGRQYDVILDAAMHHSILKSIKTLTPGGTYLLVGGSIARIFQAILLRPFLSRKNGRRIISYTANANPEDLAALGALLADGTIQAPIDQRYPLSEAALAFRYFEDGKVRGKLVITMDHYNTI